MLSKAFTSIHDISNDPFGGVVAPTNLFYGTSSSLPESTNPKASTAHWSGLSASGWWCYPCTSRLCCLCSQVALPKQCSWCFPSIQYGVVWQCWCIASLSAPGHVPPGVADSSFPQAAQQSHLPTGSAQKFCAHTTQTGCQSSHCSPSQANPNYSPLSSTRQGFSKHASQQSLLGWGLLSKRVKQPAVPDSWWPLCWDASLPTSPHAEHSPSLAVLLRQASQRVSCALLLYEAGVAGYPHPVGTPA